MTKRTCGEYMSEGEERAKMAKITPESEEIMGMDVTPESEEIMGMDVDEAPTCSFCKKCMVGFEKTLIKGSPALQNSFMHYWAQVENWQASFGHNGRSGDVCSLVPRGSHYPQIMGFPDGMPICQIFERSPRGYEAVYQLAVSKRT